MRLNGDGTVTFSVKAPVVGTRAVGDGNTANTLTCYAYDASGNYVDTFTGSMSGGKGSVTARLASGVSYKLVFWSGAADSPYTVDAEKGTMTVNYSGMAANSDANDAFYSTLEFKGGEAAQKDITLTRPLAQINFGSDDTTLPAVTKAYTSGVYTTVTTQAFTTLNLVDGTVSGETSFTAPVAAISTLERESFPVTHAESTPEAPKSYAYTNMLYALVPAAGATSDLTFKSYTSTDTSSPVWTLAVPAAPLKQNFRTNVFGSLLTTQTDFQVTVNPIFAGSTVTSVDEFKKAVEKGGSVILAEPLDMKGETIVVDPGKSLDVDLNGNNISNTAFIVNGTLNVAGNGSISAPSTAVDVPIIKVVEGGNLTLTDGTFEKGVTRSTRSEVKPCVEVTGGTATISGGVYRNEANGVAYAPVKTTGGKLIINGGSFYQADPRNYAEFGATESVLPPTAEVYTKNGYFNVLDITKVSTADELIAASAIVKEGKMEITVIKDIVIKNGASVTGGLVFNSANTILNINPGVTLTLGADANGTTATENNLYGIISPEGKNLTINNKGLICGNTRLLRAYGNITINGGNFEAYNPTKAPILWVEDGASAVINNSRFVANFYCIGSRGNVTLNGGYFEGKATNRRGAWAYAVKNDLDASEARLIVNDAEIVGVQGAIGAADGYCEINGGYFHTHRSAPGFMDNFYAVSMVDSYGAHVVINGGKFYSEAHDANHGACINWLSEFYDPGSTLEIKGGEFSSKGYFGNNTSWGAKPFVDNYLTPAEGYEWQATGNSEFPWTVVKSAAQAGRKNSNKKH